MKPAPFVYHTPESVEECLDLLVQYGDDAAVMAGGQSLLSLMKFRLATPAHIIALRDIGGDLTRIRRTETGIAVGALVTYAQVERSPEVAIVTPALLKVIPLIAHAAVRTRGTVCGNLCNADPASELPAVALVLEARMRLRSKDGERIIPAKEFFEAPYMTARRSSEVLVSVEFPQRAFDERFVIREIVRLRGGFPMAGIALAVTPGTLPGTFATASIACFGVHSVQLRLSAVEQTLVAHGCTSEGLRLAAALVDDLIEPHSDPFASADYRRAVVKTLLERSAREACAEG